MALSSTEAEYIVFFKASQEAIPLMNLIEELSANDLEIPNAKTKVKCKVFKDNMRVIELAKEEKV